MDKNAIKKYAVWARRELIARVSQKAEQYGITEKEIINERAENIHGVVLTPAQKSQRQALIHLIRRDGYQQAMEEVAYTWFNRFIALRFMEVNDYLPGHTRAFTDEQNAFKPKILSDALNLELTGLNLDKVIELKETNKTEELYQYLLITLCNHLSAILPGMFQRIDDYTELLFPEHLLREGSVLEQLVAMIPQDDWLDAVQIIGWLYEAYNIDLNALVYDGTLSKAKISKELLPAATTIFTPDWPVHCMVENSLGRLWLEGHANSSLKEELKYYLDEAEQEPETKDFIEKARQIYATLKPEDILVIDPCSGSGHILCVLFDVLLRIYEEYGYPTRDAVASIIEKNIWGLDINERAAQLAYFSLMMKARQYDRGWFRRGIEPHVYSLQDSEQLNEHSEYLLKQAGVLQVVQRLIEDFADAKEYGSIIKPRISVGELDALDVALGNVENALDNADLVQQADILACFHWLRHLSHQARALTQKYHVVVTNPPYLGNSRFSEKLDTYVKANWPYVKSDLSMVMYQHALDDMVLSDGFVAFITTTSWMYLSSFEKLREHAAKSATLFSLVDYGTELFEGKVGHNPIVSWVVCKRSIPAYRMSAVRLVDYCYARRDEKETEFFNKRNRFIAKQDNFSEIPGAPLAYWVSRRLLDLYQNPLIGTRFSAKEGVGTRNDDIFMRLFWEVSVNSIGKDHRWILTDKAGWYRKWYLGCSYVMDWEHDGFRIKNYKNPDGSLRSRPQNTQFLFRSGISWGKIGSGASSFRYREPGFGFNDAAPTLFGDDLFPLLAALNTNIYRLLLAIRGSTLNMTCGVIEELPLIGYTGDERERTICNLVQSNISISHSDWDSFETSWDFQRHPLVRWMHSRHRPEAILPLFDQCKKWQQGHPEDQTDLYVGANGTVELCFQLWRLESYMRFQQLKANEEELNRIFIDIYGLQDELTPEVADKDVTVRQADLGRDIRSLVSYAVGCMLGRYSLDKPGLVFAGGEWDAAQYVTYPADKDGVLPITDDDYFSDDVVSMFVDWVKTVFGTNELEDNLKFIATALYPNGGGTARELIRQYFLNDFYKDHLKIYQKRPIYWLFDAGKKNSFKCLIYLHRYRPDTVARVRTDYVHEMQARYRTAMEDLTHRVETTSGSERVRLQKQLVKIQGQEEELRKYEEKIHHYADMMLPLDLDDGVKVNYAKLADVLAPIK